MDQKPRVGTFNKSYEYVFTVFTPTYNRAHALPRVYQSLKEQTYRNFEWLIIDDGSTDNTGIVVKNWPKNSDFTIHYIYQKNSGKHIAFNYGVRKAKGELFLPLDSDDYCVPEALLFYSLNQKDIRFVTIPLVLLLLMPPRPVEALGIHILTHWRTVVVAIVTIVLPWLSVRERYKHSFKGQLL